MKVAPYVWFKCPNTGKGVIDQIMLTSDQLPSFFMLDCDKTFGGCGKAHKNTDVQVIAIGRYLALKKRSKFYDPKMVQDFEVFLKHFGYDKLPESPNILSKLKQKL